MPRPTARMLPPLIALLACGLDCRPAVAGAMPYTISDLGVAAGQLVPDANGTFIQGLNNKGSVLVGISSPNNFQAFIYSDGRMVPTAANAAAINDAGQVAVPTSQFTPYAINESGTTVGALNYGPLAIVPGGGVSPITLTNQYGVPQTGFALGINDAGQVVGWLHSGQSNLAGSTAQHAFLYSGGKLIDLAAGSPAGLDPLTGNGSLAHAINNSGQIVGSLDYRDPATGARSVHPFLYSGGRFIDLLSPALDWTARGTATGINDAGQVVGWLNGHAFLYQNGAMTDLAALVQGTGVGSIESTSFPLINNAGQIAFDATVDGTHHAFLLTPQAVPEPGATAVLAVVGVALMVRRRSRRGS